MTTLTNHARPKKMTEQVYMMLLDMIVSKKFEVGDRLPTEKKLSDTFEVSRPVVRTAIQQLQMDGLVESRQGSGTYILRQPPAKLVDLIPDLDISLILRGFELRIALEGMNARFAATRHEPKELRLIERSLELMKEDFESGGSSSSRRDYDFHLAVAEASQNDLSVKVLDSLRQPFEGAITVGITLGKEGTLSRQKRVIEEHERIYQAILNRDPDSAELAMKFHLDQARYRLIDHSTNR